MALYKTPWQLIVSEEWPFGIKVISADGHTILEQDPYAFSNKAQSRKDIDSAAQIQAEERKHIMKRLANQTESLYLMAAAPELQRCLRQFLLQHSPASSKKCKCRLCQEARLALKQAKPCTSKKKGTNHART